MTARSNIEGLNGSQLTAAGSGSWRFIGAVAIENVRRQGETIRFDVLVPATENDFDDFIVKKDLIAGTTDKVTLTQGGSEIPGLRALRVAREGPDRRFEHWTLTEANQYRFTFEVPAAADVAEETLELHLRASDPNRGRLVDVATATGRRLPPTSAGLLPRLQALWSTVLRGRDRTR